MMEIIHPFVRIVCDGTYGKLLSGELVPRVGDFVSSRVAPSRCGIVLSIGEVGRKRDKISAFVVQGHPLGTAGTFTILENDIQFIAPREME